MYLADTHTHTRISIDCDVPLEQQLQAARAAGLNGLWVTDHFDLLGSGGRRWTRFDWPAALEQFHTARDAIDDGFELRLGLELGSAPFDPALARSVLAQPGDELDFVLGSLHNWIGYYGNEEFYCTSFVGDSMLCTAAMDNAIKSTWALVREYPDCYDSLAHINYPVRYMVRDGHDLSILDWEDQLRPILTEVARTDHALEVNTCRGTDLEVWPAVLGWFKDCGGKYVTAGSDAHSPRFIGGGIAEARAMIEAAGLEYTVFRERKPAVVF